MRPCRATRVRINALRRSRDRLTDKKLIDHMYIALATASQQLRLVRVSINWGLPPADQKMPPGGQPLNPTMHAKYLAISSWMPCGPSTSPTDVAMTQLSHIELLPSVIDTGGNQLAPIKVVIVRSYLPTANSPYSEHQSIIDMWDLVYEPVPALHPAFEQIGGRRNSTAGTPDKVSMAGFSSYRLSITDKSKDLNKLKKSDPITVEKIVIGIQPIQFGKAICFLYSDGSIEYRDRITMQETYNEQTLDKIMILNQAGYTFNEPAPCMARATFVLVIFANTPCRFTNGAISEQLFHRSGA